MLLLAPHPATEPVSLAAVGSEASKPAGPPWLYGRADARFTVVGYADLECPYCRAYFPALKRWIDAHPERSEEHTSELQSLMRISYAVFCLKKKNTINKKTHKQLNT